MVYAVQYVRNYVQPTTGFMTNVTCGLTAKKPESAPCPTLVIEYGTTFLLYGPFSALLTLPWADKALRYGPCELGDHTVLPAAHARTIGLPPLLPRRTESQPFGYYSIAPTHGGMARLSWPGWLVIYCDRFSAPGVEPRTGHPSQ